MYLLKKSLQSCLNATNARTLLCPNISFLSSPAHQHLHQEREGQPVSMFCMHVCWQGACAVKERESSLLLLLYCTTYVGQGGDQHLLFSCSRVYQPGHAVWKGLCTSGWTSLLYVSFHMNFHCLFSCLKFSFSFCLRIHNLSRIYRLETQLYFLFLPLPLPLSSSACWSKIVWE